MRHLFFALPFVLLPALSMAHDHHEHDHGHASLTAHQHGAAQLDVALDDSRLEIALHTPAINLLGFEHAPGDDTQRARVNEARAQLKQPHRLFGLPEDAACRVSEQRIESPLLSNTAAGHQNHDEDEQHHHEENGHSDIHVHYRLDCGNPDALTSLDLRELFKSFPGTETVQLQLIGPNGQTSMTLQPEHSIINF